MRSPEQVALDITNGDIKARLELETMWGKNFEEMTVEERCLGVAVLAGTERYWNN